MGWDSLIGQTYIKKRVVIVPPEFDGLKVKEGLLLKGNLRCYY